MPRTPRWRRSRRRGSGSASRCHRPTTRSCTRWSAPWSGHEHGAARLLAAALAAWRRVHHPLAAVALRRRLPGDRVLGRPGCGGRRATPAADPLCRRPRSLLGPVRGQYKEFFIVANAMLGGEHVTTCPYIWVDRDFALIRGWIQGFPKKLGEVHITRSFGLDCRAEGRTFAGTLTAHGRLLAEATVTPERVSDTGPQHNDPPLVNRRHFPRLAAGSWGDPAVDELVRARSSNRSASEVRVGPATLTLHGAPGEEHQALA